MSWRRAPRNMLPLRWGWSRHKHAKKAKKNEPDTCAVNIILKMNLRLYGFELHWASIKGTKLLFQVLQAIIIIMKRAPSRAIWYGAAAKRVWKDSFMFVTWILHTWHNLFVCTTRDMAHTDEGPRPPKRCPQVWPWFGRSLFSTNFFLNLIKRCSNRRA